MRGTPLARRMALAPWSINGVSRVPIGVLDITAQPSPKRSSQAAAATHGSRFTENRALICVWPHSSAWQPATRCILSDNIQFVKRLFSRSVGRASEEFRYVLDLFLRSAYGRHPPRVSLRGSEMPARHTRSMRRPHPGALHPSGCHRPGVFRRPAASFALRYPCAPAWPHGLFRGCVV